jgi:hypothetical protein
MGLKGYGLWAMGQLDSTLQRPTSNARASALACAVASFMMLIIFFGHSL